MAEYRPRGEGKGIAAWNCLDWRLARHAGLQASDIQEGCLVHERRSAWLRGALERLEDDFSVLAATARAPPVTVG